MAEESNTQLTKYTKTENVKTYNIAGAISEIIKRDKVTPASIDFDIRKVNTYIKEPGSKDFDALNEFHLKHLYDESYMLSEKLQITQEYIIKFKPFVFNPNFDIKISLSTDPNKTMAKVTVKKESSIGGAEDLKKSLLTYFNKLKIKNGMLIGIVDKEMLDSINILANTINQKGKLSEDFSFWLTKWKKPIVSQDDSIDLRYRKKNKKELKETDKVDYADRDFLVGVKPGEILVVYQKAIKGKVGRSYSGRFIPVTEPSMNNLPTFDIDHGSIEIEESDGKKLYKAKEDGFITIDKGILKVSREIKLKNINLKETGHVKPGIKSQVTVKVESGNPAVDAVGVDMMIESTEVVIEGSVGVGAVIKGEKVIVKGQMHQSAKIYGNEVEVNVLKGTIYGNLVNVKSVEGATIHGCNVTVEQLFGGKVHGSKVIIKELRAPSEIRAAFGILLEKIACGDNKLFIDQSAILTWKREIDACKILISEGRACIQEGTLTLTNTAKYLKDNKESFEQIRENLRDAKERKVPAQPALIKMFKDYVGKIETLKDLQEKLHQCEKDIEESQNKLLEFDKLMKNGFIYNEGLAWDKRHEVNFVYHGVNSTVNRVIDSIPAAEMLCAKAAVENENEIVIANGTREDFPYIDIHAEPEFDFDCKPLLIEEEPQEEEEMNEKEKKKDEDIGKQEMKNSDKTQEQ